jgi:ribokinase
LSEAKKELEEFLEEQKLKTCQVVVLPDFFLDRFINLKLSLSQFSRLAAGVAKRKGGSIDGIAQTEMRGGNAINVASALASLGVKVAPIVCTNEHGFQQLNYFLKKLPVDTSHVKIRDKASITTALEFQDKKVKTNVMLRDLGSLEDFGPADLDDKDYRMIEDADFLCVFNWAGTLRFGTALAEAVFSVAKKNGRGKTYYDTADPTPNSRLVSELIGKVLKSNQVDIFSVNENEAVTYAKYLDESFGDQKEHEFAVLAMEAARILKKHLSSRIDLHTSLFSATLRSKTEVVVPAFKIKIKRATGAGDAWTAGNILGDHNGLSDECRLMLANAVSACYLSDPKGNHPTWEKIRSFLTNKI